MEIGNIQGTARYFKFSISSLRLRLEKRMRIFCIFILCYFDLKINCLLMFSIDVNCLLMFQNACRPVEKIKS